MTSVPNVYPSELEANIATRDGSLVQVRPIRATDAARLLEFLKNLPDEDRRLRFFSLGNDLPSAARDESNVDYVTSLGLLAVEGPDEHVVGHALYAKYGETCAEIAFAIAREFQGRGLATLLLGQLAEAATENGIDTFEALVLPENARMLEVFRESGFPIKTRFGGDSIEVTFPTSLTPEALRRFEQREETAAASAVRRFLYPRSVAVIGASRRPGSVGAAVLRNLVDSGFRGPVYPINPTASTIRCMPCYPSIEVAPDPVDVAVIALHASQVVEAAQQCGRKQVKALIVLSAGFDEVGEAGRTRQAELARVCSEYGMRLIGPNCIGVINTDPEAPLNATFGPLMPKAGPVALATQSGAMGLAAIDFTAARESFAGFSSVVSMGNKADISTNDLFSYWQTDPRTEVILLYLESFGNPRKFARLARSITRSKPIVALKSGRSAVGARATASHTGALLAASDVTIDALFSQAGVVRTDTLDEMLDVADLLVHQPLPAGPRVAILTNVGGPAVMCADMCEARGLVIPPLSDATQTALRQLLPAEASVANPVDMLAAATPDQYRDAVRVVADDPNVDSVIVIFLPPLVTQPEEVGRALTQAVSGMSDPKPVLGVFMASGAVPDLTTADGRRIPAHRTPEPAAIALTHVVHYARQRSRPVEAPPQVEGLDIDGAAMLLGEAVRAGGGWLEPEHVRQLLMQYGIPVLEQRQVTSPLDAGSAAAELGGEVALKLVAAGVLHKSDVGGVKLHLRGSDAVKCAAEDMLERIPGVAGFVVQQMAAPGVEMLVGVVNDPRFGPTIACGAGGTQAELLKDISVRLSPLTSEDASSMIRELRTFPLLDGYRGAPLCDVAALEDVLLRIGALADDHACIAELDLNPVIVSQSGACVVDARVRIEHVPPRHPLGSRH